MICKQRGLPLTKDMDDEELNAAVDDALDALPGRNENEKATQKLPQAGKRKIPPST